MKSEIYGLVLNLKNALKLVFFRKVELVEFRTGTEQVMLIVLFYSSLTFFNSLLSSLPEPEFSLEGIANVATQVSLIVIAVFLISKYTKLKTEILFIITLSLWSWFYLVWVIFIGGDNFSIWNFIGSRNVIYLLYSVYFLLALSVALVRIADVNLRTSMVIFTYFLLIVFIPLQYIYSREFWHLSYNYEKELEKYKKINQEDTYYKQFDFIRKMQRDILPSRKNKTDLYFVGFGSYGSEDVFMKEINYARNLFDRRFGTKGRSIALINNYKTVDDVPLATRSNLSLVLQQLGKVMDTKDDVLFLYLTSHGSEKHRLSVELMPLNLNTLGPDELKTYLDNAGIKWRILIVSACYSGGFLEPLKDPYTVVVTASASDRQSFGCGSKSEFTYFGNAIFREQFSKSFNFLDVFKNAIESVKQREIHEKRKASKPQIFIGKEIKGKLMYLSEELNK